MASCLGLAAILFVSRLTALADGGVLMLRERTGPFVITLFSQPAVTPDHPADVSVMVQQRDTGALLLDASVDLFFTPPTGVVLSEAGPYCKPDGTSLQSIFPGSVVEPRVIRATRAQASNKLLYAASVVLPAAGNWRMRVRVKHRDADAGVACALQVVDRRSPLDSTWFCLAIPPLVISLFAANQFLRRRRTNASLAESTGSPGRQRSASSSNFDPKSDIHVL